MANPEHVELLRRGPEAWNSWRREHPQVRPDLSRPRLSKFESDVQTLAEAVMAMVLRDQAPPNDTALSGLQLTGANLSKARLAKADLSRTIFVEASFAGADLREANLSGCILTHADLGRADLTGANLTGAMLRWAKLGGTNLRGAILHMADLGGVEAVGAQLQKADLSYSNLVQANFKDANLDGAHVYGMAAWNVDLTNAQQSNLSITRANEPLITVDDLQVAQFLYLMLNNRNIRAVIDTLTTKLVLLLGRFTRQRKPVLDALRKHLRERDFLPILFDFDRPASRDFTETVVALAHLARFVIADITDPASVPKELEAIVPRLAIPVQPIIHKKARPYAMLQDYWKYDWVLPLQRYASLQSLLASFDRKVVAPLETKARQLAQRRKRALARG